MAEILSGFYVILIGLGLFAIPWFLAPPLAAYRHRNYHRSTERVLDLQAELEHRGHRPVWMEPGYTESTSAGLRAWFENGQLTRVVISESEGK
ncbi:MAG: hypothetical protein ACRC8S_06975 [Fimbriiglobus sp.]